MMKKKRRRPQAPTRKRRTARPGRKQDNLSAEDAQQFRAWLSRVRERWEAGGRPWLGTLLERAPCRKRSDGTTEEELPERDRDWVMRAQNPSLPLSRKKAIEICLRLWRHNIRMGGRFVVNDNIARMLLDDARDEAPLFLPDGGAAALANYLINALERRSISISEIGRSFLFDYLSRYEAFTSRDPRLSKAVNTFVSEHRRIGWWNLSRSSDFRGIEPQRVGAQNRACEPISASASADSTELDELTTFVGSQQPVTELRGVSIQIDGQPTKAMRFSAPSLFARLEQETRGMKFDVRTPRKKKTGST
jgi:hypothetical protein